MNADLDIMRDQLAMIEMTKEVESSRNQIIELNNTLAELKDDQQKDRYELFEIRKEFSHAKEEFYKN